MPRHVCCLYCVDVVVAERYCKHDGEQRILALKAAILSAVPFVEMARFERIWADDNGHTMH